MSQITLYLDEANRALVEQAAKANGVSKTRWVADLIRTHAAHDWPQDCLALAGRFTDFPLGNEAQMRLAALAQLLRPMQILPFDTECAAHAAGLRATLESAGTPTGPHDTLTAATVLRHQATLVTRNVKEFSRMQELQWLNWHEDLAGKGL